MTASEYRVSVSDFELRVLQRIKRQKMVSGNGMVAISAAARRLERKGLTGKGTHWYLTATGEQYLASINTPTTADTEEPSDHDNDPVRAESVALCRAVIEAVKAMKEGKRGE